VATDIHLDHWISWKPGSGIEVCLGRDNILGLGPSSFLSSHLIDALKQKNISMLAQVWKQQDQNTFLSNWKDSGDLGLTGELSREWQQFRQGIAGSWSDSYRE
jgi:hypothetical protein